MEFADTAFAAHGKRVGRISVSLVLIPRPDNPFDSDAVSIALPKSMGGDEEDRCLGYLYRHTIHNWGIGNAGGEDLVAQLAALSADGEVHFTATMSDRPAVIEALAREGIALPFDPTPGWLNATLHRDSDGWIHVVWVGRIAGLNVEPILASFDVTNKELHVFAAEIAAPIQGLLRRAGHAPEAVLLCDHPSDPDQFFGQDLITRLECPPTVRMLRPEARVLITAEWADRIEARWRAIRDNQWRNEPISHTILSSSPVEHRPPDDPQPPPGLLIRARSMKLTPTTHRVGYVAKP
ncbi:hypothetical protein [[Mycobacterium] zoologicum]|uniref:hypothetical protein n=1 Tax=[Mycobacterium] zoologicum TaxID=2872311 RepID=UPI002B993B49|nr:hypothetical protein [Mycolicibacter sp. MYC101]MEB3065668.1 hypothetical protein [Mycolicibacter sp. MYC101]